MYTDTYRSRQEQKAHAVQEPTTAALVKQLADLLDLMDEDTLRAVRERLCALAVAPDSMRAREALASALAPNAA